jgi:hypothetical protein
MWSIQRVLRYGSPRFLLITVPQVIKMPEFHIFITLDSLQDHDAMFSDMTHMVMDMRGGCDNAMYLESDFECEVSSDEEADENDGMDVPRRGSTAWARERANRVCMTRACV